jgi:hypothetical protein
MIHLIALAAAVAVNAAMRTTAIDVHAIVRRKNGLVLLKMHAPDLLTSTTHYLPPPIEQPEVIQFSERMPIPAWAGFLLKAWFHDHIIDGGFHYLSRKEFNSQKGTSDHYKTGRH